MTMLEKQGILTKEEKDQIIEGLESICRDVENKTLEITEEYEDIHSFVEANLIDRIGDAGKKLHTGRSRNDQVALDMKLYTRDEITHLDSLLRELMEVLLKLMEENTETYMPGFIHLQRRSRLLWHIIWELILKCLSATIRGCGIFIKDEPFVLSEAELMERHIRWTENIQLCFSDLTVRL